MKKFFTLLIILGLFTSAICAASPQKQPLQCFVSINKSAEWNNYDVRVDMFSMSETLGRQAIMSFELPKSATKEITNVVKPFDCQKYQRFIFTATYTPAIWQTPEGKPMGNVSDSRGIFDIAAQVAKPAENQNNLIVTLKFPEDFNLNENPAGLKPISTPK